MRVDDLFAFIKARHAVAENRAAGKPKPWTKDKILLNYRFCNVYRELDTVTVWIAKNWRKPNAKNAELWFALVVARLLNWPPTLAALGFPVPWVAAPNGKGSSTVSFSGMVRAREAEGLQVYGGAYTISTNGRKMVKWQYLEEQVFEPLWLARGEITALILKPKVTLAEVHAKLMEFQGMGSFMAAQVIADLKYVQLKKAPDWWTWAASGPGSRRGLNRVLNLDKDKAWKEHEWLENLQILHDRIGLMAAEAGMPPLHAQDLQNCLCEFDKYERVRLGEGTPRCRYPGAA